MKIYKNLNKLLIVFSSLLILSLLSACSSGSDDDGGGSSGSGKIRYVNANFRLPESFIFRGSDFSDPDEELLLLFGESTDYSSVGEGSISFFVFEDASPVLGEPFTARIRSGSHTSIILTSDGEKDSIVFADDMSGEPGGGLFNLRVGNFFSGSEKVDVYLLNTGFSVADAEPTFAGVDFQDLSSYETAAVVPSRIVVTSEGSKSALLDTGAIIFEDRKNFTFYILSGLGGSGSPSGFILQDGD